MSNSEMLKIKDNTISVFIEPSSCGVKNNKGDIILLATCSTHSLRKEYTYNVCCHKRTKKFYFWVEPHINMPFYIELEKVAQ